MAIAFNLPIARDATFVATDKYPNDTEMRLQAATIGHRAQLVGQKTIVVSPQNFWLQQKEQPFGTHMLLGYIERDSGTLSPLAAMPKFPNGTKLIGWTCYIYKAGGPATTIRLRKTRYKAPGEGLATTIGTTQVSPGSGVGDTLLDEVLAEPYTFVDGERVWWDIFVGDNADRIYGMTVDVDFNLGLTT